MKVDIRELGQFNHLASQGAERAAESLSQLAGVQMGVEVTDVSLVTETVLAETFTDRSFVGVEVGLEGGLEGETVLAFERERAMKLQDLLMSVTDNGGAEERLAKSSVTELGNIMIGGFIDGWANHLDTAINMTPPRYTEANGPRILPDQAIEAAKKHGVFLFESKLTGMDTDLDFSLYMLPEYRQFVQLLSGNEQGNQIPVNRLSTFEQLAKEGAGNAADQIGMMTGLDTNVDVSRLRFVPLAGVPKQVGNDQFVGVVFELTGLPSGYLVVLFGEESATTIANAMMPGGGAEDEIGEMTEGAIKELGNIMTSGFIDGWANVLQTSIEHSPPNFVHDMGESIMSPVVGKLGQQQDYAFVIDSTIEIDGNRGQCDIYALPNERELARALSALPARD
ncbi:MAG: chemotaxis protein CheC, inhibitor of MCP methylation [Halonotius sp. J07HN4]|jgi:Chemotaxis protein CheC, inhibitor of MCP methylation|nr:MAG: chemotaxis protein CheC, inhibitor of MCP methylation [Halonotius sp. J07HN4]